MRICQDKRDLRGRQFLDGEMLWLALAGARVALETTSSQEQRMESWEPHDIQKAAPRACACVYMRVVCVCVRTYRVCIGVCLCVSIFA